MHIFAAEKFEYSFLLFRVWKFKGQSFKKYTVGFENEAFVFFFIFD